MSTNGSDIKKAKIANNNSTNLNYRGDVSLFYFNQPGQIVVTGSGHNVWLGGENGQTFTNVSTIYAGASSGCNTLVGNDQPNIIIGGGAGGTSLWGGTGSITDTLIGGQGSDLFYAGRFEGNDVIYTDQAQDTIFLYDTNLSDIKSTKFVGDLIEIGFNSGTFLNVHNNTEITPTFQFADGTRYNYNRITNQWQGSQ